MRTPKSFEELTGGPGFDPRRVGNFMDGLTVGSVVAAAEDLWRRVQSVSSANLSPASPGEIVG